MSCKKCGVQVNPEAKFCKHCGEAITKEPTEQFCPGCGVVLSDDAKFCEKCGVPRRHSTEPTPPAQPIQPQAVEKETETTKPTKPPTTSKKQSPIGSAALVLFFIGMGVLFFVLGYEEGWFSFNNRAEAQPTSSAQTTPASLPPALSPEPVVLTSEQTFFYASFPFVPTFGSIITNAEFLDVTVLDSSLHGELGNLFEYAYRYRLPHRSQNGLINDIFTFRLLLEGSGFIFQKEYEFQGEYESVVSNNKYFYHQGQNASLLLVYDLLAYQNIDGIVMVILGRGNAYQQLVNQDAATTPPQRPNGSDTNDIGSHTQYNWANRNNLSLSNEARAMGVMAIEITNEFLDGHISASETSERLGALVDENEVADASHVRIRILGIRMSLFSWDITPTDENFENIRNTRDSLAELINSASLFTDFGSDRTAITGVFRRAMGGNVRYYFHAANIVEQWSFGNRIFSGTYSINESTVTLYRHDGTIERILAISPDGQMLFGDFTSYDRVS